MAFYVPLGPRGLLFRLGTFVIGIWGGLVYRLAYRRRESWFLIPGRFRPLILERSSIHHWRSARRWRVRCSGKRS